MPVVRPECFEAAVTSVKEERLGSMLNLLQLKGGIVERVAFSDCARIQ
jgi:hypothetical protein